MTTKIEYQVVLNDGLSVVEIARLRSVIPIFEIINAEFESNNINLTLPLETRQEIFPMIAAWLSYIGAERDIFCIKETKTHYTEFVSQEIKELLRT